MKIPYFDYFETKKHQTYWRMFIMDGKNYNGYLVHIVPTLICNLDCQYCYTKTLNLKSPRDELDFIKKTSSVINKLNISCIHIEGGEPMLYPYLSDLIKSIEKKDRVTIVTNGYMLNNTTASSIINAGVNNFIISIDYPIEYTELTKKSCVSSLAVLRNIGIIPRINVTLSKDNLNQMEDLFHLASQNDITDIRFGDVVAVGGAMKYKSKILSSEDYEILISDFYECTKLFTNLNATLSLHGGTFEKCNEQFRSQYSQFAKRFICDMHDSKITILPNGDIYTCYSLITNNKYFVGNIYDEFDWETSSRYKKIKRKKCLKCPIGIDYHIGFNRM